MPQKRAQKDMKKLDMYARVRIEVQNRRLKRSEGFIWFQGIYCMLQLQHSSYAFSGNKMPAIKTLCSDI
jgi:hypothetical protein